MLGTLATVPALSRPDLLASPVADAVTALPDPSQVWVAEIDPALADTAAFCEAYDVGLEVSANCVVVVGRRGETRRWAAAVVLATTKADVNGAVRRHLEARRASFAGMDEAVAGSAMEYGGITPIGLPANWPVLVDPAVAATDHVVIGSGIRGSKLVVPGALVAGLPAAEIIDGLALAR
jgi:prolyl-tRNA editing enzyme YbaK/EbsC (Cys-tRNA(Pro) deacylase)